MEYESRGNLLRTTDAQGRTTRSIYDARNNLLAQTDALGHTTRYAYEEYGHVISTTDPLGNTTLYGYDEFGQRGVVTDALGNVTRYLYDALGRRVGEVYPDASGPITVTTAYDPLGRPMRIEYPPVGEVPGFTVEIAYDALGHRTVVTDAVGVTRYDYDALYRPLGIAAPTGEAR